MTQNVIKNIEARRLTFPGGRWVDINFQVLDKSSIKGYCVCAIPTIGKIRQHLIFDEGDDSSHAVLTVKYLKVNVGYKFKVHAVYEDKTISNEVETETVEPVTSTAVRNTPANVATFVHADSGEPTVNMSESTINFHQISIIQNTTTGTPETAKNVRIVSRVVQGQVENIDIKWDPPSFNDIWAFQLTQTKVRFFCQGEEVASQIFTEPERSECFTRFFLGKQYKACIAIRYWDVDSDCEKSSTSESLYFTTAPPVVNPDSIKWKWKGRTLKFWWTRPVGAKSYTWELRDQNQHKIGGENTDRCESSWNYKDCHEGYVFSFNIFSRNDDIDKQSEVVTIYIPIDSTLIRTDGCKNERSGPDFDETEWIETKENMISSELKLRLQIGEKIKDDDMKWVYRGQFSSSVLTKDREVAVKILGASEYEDRELTFTDGKDMKKRMVREAQNLLELINHPNVVQYICSCEKRAGDRIYIAMELCSDKTLDDRIKNREDHKELDDPKYCKVVILHITQGLHYMHSKNLLHRDIKPSNILFSLDEKVVKISDFGFSKKINPDTGKVSNTRTTGTDCFRPPETYIDPSQKAIRDRSDVFSLGLVFFILLSKGKHPFGECALSQPGNIKNKQERSLEGLTGPDAALAKDLIQQMLDYDLTKRPDTSEILKHPYFWNVETLVGFYIRVVDHISSTPTEQSGHEGSNEEKRNDFIKKVSHEDSTLRKVAGHDYLTSNVENQVQLFFHVAKVAADAQNPELGTTCDFFRELEKVKRKRESFNSLSPSISNSLEEQAKFYIQVIHRIPDVLKEFENWESPERDSDSQGSQGSSSNDDASEGDPNEIRKEQDPSSSPMAANGRCNSMSDDIEAIDSDGDPILKIARQTVGEILQQNNAKGGTKKEAFALLDNVSAIAIDPLLAVIDSFTCTNSEESDDVHFENKKPSGQCRPGKSWDDSLKTCLVPYNTSLRNEFIPVKDMQDLEKAEADIKSASVSEDIRTTIQKAKALVTAYRNIPSYNKGALKSEETEQNKTLKRPENKKAQFGAKSIQNRRTAKLNNLILRRRRYLRIEWQKFEQRVKKLEEQESSHNHEITEEVLSDLYSQATKLVQMEIKGVKKTWQECVEDEVMLHKYYCDNRPCVKLAKNATGISNNDIFYLIKYIRNNLVHFEETKMSNSGNWMEQHEEILNFVTAAVPELFPHMFKVMKDELKDYIEENKQQESSFFLPHVNTQSNARTNILAKKQN